MCRKIVKRCTPFINTPKSGDVAATYKTIGEILVLGGQLRESVTVLDLAITIFKGVTQVDCAVRTRNVQNVQCAIWQSCTTGQPCLVCRLWCGVADPSIQPTNHPTMCTVHCIPWLACVVAAVVPVCDTDRGTMCMPALWVY